VEEGEENLHAAKKIGKRKRNKNLVQNLVRTNNMIVFVYMYVGLFIWHYYFHSSYVDLDGYDSKQFDLGGVEIRARYNHREANNCERISVVVAL